MCRVRAKIPVARKLGQEQNKGKERGGGGGEAEFGNFTSFFFAEDNKEIYQDGDVLVAVAVVVSLGPYW